MSDPVVLIQFDGDAGKLGGAIREAQTWLGALDESAHRAGSAVSGSLSKGADAAGAKLQGLKKIAAGLGFGGVAGDVEDLADGLTGMGAAAGVAAGGLLAIGGSVYALYEVTEAITGAALGLEEYSERAKGLDALGSPIPAETVETARDANTAFQALGLAVERIGSIYGDYYVPIVEEVALQLVSVTLAVGDFVQGVSDASKAVLKLVADMTPLDEIMRSLSGVTGGYRDRAEELVEQLQAQGDATDKLRDLEERLSEHRKAQAAAEREAEQRREKAAAAREKQLASEGAAIERLWGIAEQSVVSQLDGLDRLDAERQQAIARIQEEAEAAGDSAEAHAAASAAMAAIDAEYSQKRYDLIGQIAAAEAEARQTRLDEERAYAEELWADYQARQEERREAEDAEHAEKMARLEEFADQSLNAYDQIAGAVADLASLRMEQEAESIDSIQRRIDKLQESNAKGNREKIAQLKAEMAEAKRAGEEAFKVNQAAQYASAVVNGAAAITRAFAELGPAAGAVAAAAIATTTGVQLAKIASAEPKFHDGRSHDEERATLLRSEAVLGPRATSQLPAEAIDRWNATGTPPWASQSGPSVALFAPNGREIDSLASRLGLSGRDTATASRGAYR